MIDNMFVVFGCFIMVVSALGFIPFSVDVKIKRTAKFWVPLLCVGAMSGLCLYLYGISEDNGGAKRRQAQAQTQVVQKLLRGEEISGAEYGSLICSFPTIAKEMKLPPEVAKKFGEPWRFTIRFNTNDIALEATDR